MLHIKPEHDSARARLEGVKGVLSSAAEFFSSLRPSQSRCTDDQVKYFDITQNEVGQAWSESSEMPKAFQSHGSLRSNVVAVPHMPGSVAATALKPGVARRLEELGILPAREAKVYHVGSSSA